MREREGEFAEEVGDLRGRGVGERSVEAEGGTVIEDADYTLCCGDGLRRGVTEEERGLRNAVYMGIAVKIVRRGTSDC